MINFQANVKKTGSSYGLLYLDGYEAILIRITISGFAPHFHWLEDSQYLAGFDFIDFPNPYVG